MVWLTGHVYLWVSCCPTDVSLRGHRSLSEELEKQHEEVKFDSKTPTHSGLECHMTVIQVSCGTCHVTISSCVKWYICVKWSCHVTRSCSLQLISEPHSFHKNTFLESVYRLPPAPPTSPAAPLPHQCLQRDPTTGVSWSVVLMTIQLLAWLRPYILGYHGYLSPHLLFDHRPHSHRQQRRSTR